MSGWAHLRGRCSPGRGGVGGWDGRMGRPDLMSAILHCAVRGWRQAGCPSGQRERSVKPSAQPTLVRTQHLPLPAEAARELGIPRYRGPSCVVPWWVIFGQQTSLCGSGYGHIADGIGAGGAVHRTACWSGANVGMADSSRPRLDWLGSGAVVGAAPGIAVRPQIKSLLLCQLS